MPLKILFNRLQPIQLHIVLVLSIGYFLVQMAFSYITHSLTLLMASYHMLCNILALGGCILTIKHSTKSTEDSKSPSADKTIAVSNNDKSLARSERSEMKLRNTFGWTRIDILTMLIVGIILASLSFSLIVEAIQTLVHIDHQDTMHLPVSIMILGVVGIVLNLLTYLLIGGYTMHQGSFLHVTPAGDVVLDRAMSNSRDFETLKADERQLSKTKNDQQLKEELEAELGQVHTTTASKRQGAVEMLRDLSSTIFVIVCAIIVYMAEDEQHTAKFIDPLLSIFSCVLLVSLSYPYLKESCRILLQTIPGSIDMENFERNLSNKFPEIVGYHDLHIWQLSAHKNVATIHIQFQNSQLYYKVIEDVKLYFRENGITQVTIQPEFDHSSKSSQECLMQCTQNDCIEKVCCRDSRTDLREVSVCPSGKSEHSHHHHSHGHQHSADSKSKALSISKLLKFNKSSNDVNISKSLPIAASSKSLSEMVSETNPSPVASNDDSSTNISHNIEKSEPEVHEVEVEKQNEISTNTDAGVQQAIQDTKEATAQS